MPLLHLDPLKYKTMRFQLRISFISIFIVMSTGVLGYMNIEGWSFLDSLFMTIITLASVGYGETHPLSNEGRVFTIFLIVLGVIVLANLVSQMVKAVSEGYFMEGLHEKQIQRALSRLNHHHILCGYGRIGQQISNDFLIDKIPLVVIERDNYYITKARQQGFLVVEGDATSEETLITAGIEKATCILCALPNDAENLSVVISAKALNKNILTISRATSEDGAKKLSRVGTDKIVSPYLAGAKRMATLAVRPQIVDYVELSSISSEKYYLEEFLLTKNKTTIIDKSLENLKIKENTGVILIAIRRKTGEMLPQPHLDTVLNDEDLLVCMGTNEELRLFTSLFFS